MSRAFVEDAENKSDDSPDRSLSPHRNLVTKEGLAASRRGSRPLRTSSA
jgi:hypothetical protein